MASASLSSHGPSSSFLTLPCTLPGVDHSLIRRRVFLYEYSCPWPDGFHPAHPVVVAHRVQDPSYLILCRRRDGACTGVVALADRERRTVASGTMSWPNVR